jgi:hypothetical protein
MPQDYILIRTQEPDPMAASEQLEISPAARDFIVDMNWGRIPKSRAYIPAIVWMSGVEGAEWWLGIGLSERDSIDHSRLTVCEGQPIDILNLLPDEVWMKEVRYFLDLEEERLVLVKAA